MILSYDANLGRMEFSERTGFRDQVRGYARDTTRQTVM
jgi:hypothetical protein